MHPLPWKARCGHAHFLLPLNPNLLLRRDLGFSGTLDALPPWFLRWWDESFLFQRFCGWWDMYSCSRFRNLFVLPRLAHVQKMVLEIPKQINCGSCLYRNWRKKMYMHAHALGPTSWHELWRSTTSQTKETRIPRHTYHGWVLKSWLKHTPEFSSFNAFCSCRILSAHARAPVTHY